MLTSNDQAVTRRLRDELFVSSSQHVPLSELTPELWREAFTQIESWRNGTSAPAPDIESYHELVELRPGLTASIAVPRGDGPFPVMLIAHGPALSAGSPELLRRFAQDVAANGYIVVTPDFRLAPEHPFPAGYDDMRFALDWIHLNIADWRGDPSRIVLLGDSLGAALGLGLIFGLKDEPDAPEVKAFVGIDGPFDFSGATPPFSGWYLGESGEALLADKRVSPLPHLHKDLELPSILLIVGSASWGLSATLDAAAQLHEAGVDFQLHVLEGMPHDFMTFPELDGMWEGHRLMFDYLSRSL